MTRKKDKIDICSICGEEIKFYDYIWSVESKVACTSCYEKHMLTHFEADRIAKQKLYAYNPKNYIVKEEN